MVKSRALTVVSTLTALTAYGATPAFARDLVALDCGAVVTTDIMLAADVLNCAGDGLLIGGDGITINLNGHTVGGDASEGTADVGIRVLGHSGVTVTNGSVQGFDRGVVFDFAPQGVVTAMLVHDNSRRGIVLVNGSDNGRIEHNVSADNRASGIAVVDSDSAVVEHNQSLRNAGGAGVRLAAATHTTVSHNMLNGNVSGVQGDGSNDNLISDNRLADNAEMGVAFDSGDRNLVTGNDIERSNTGVGIGGNENVITDNRVSHSAAPDGIGIQSDGNRNVIAGNKVTDSIRYGIEIDDFPDNGSPASGNVVRDNVVRGGAEGIAIGPEAGGVVLNTVIEHNVVSGATDDGIQLIGPSTGLETSTLTRNVAVHNGDLGIETVPGTIDGGGNHAAGNGNPLQCLNVACR